MKQTIYILLLSLSLFISHFSSAQTKEMIDYATLAQLPVTELFQTGESYYKQNYTDTAMGYYIIVAGKYDQSMSQADKYMCALACITVSEIYFKQNNYQQSFEMCFKGIQICEDNKLEDLLARFYKNMGNIYSVHQDFPLATNYYLKGLKLAQKYQEQEVEARLLSNLTTTYTTINNLDEAERYYRQMMELPYKDSLKTYHKYFNKALIYVFSERNKEAVEPFRKAVDYALKAKLEPQYITSAIGDLAQLYQLLHQNDSALHYFHMNEKYTLEHDIPFYYIGTLKSLAAMYDSIGNQKKAEYYHQKQLHLSDSILNQEKYNQLKNAQIVYELDRNYNKINNLTKDKAEKEAQVRQQRKTILLVSFGLCLFIAVSIFIYRQKRKLYEAYTDLYRKNKELVQSEQALRRLRNEYERRLQQPIVQTTVSPAEEKRQQETISDGIEEKTTDPLLNNTENTDTVRNEHKEALLKQITYIMEETDKFCDCDFSLERLADLVDSNSKYVSQIINETYKKNFRTFVNEYRIKTACIRLADSENYGQLTIQAIGESVGYKSRTNFSDIFKKTTGLTPAMYQKMALEGSEGL